MKTKKIIKVLKFLKKYCKAKGNLCFECKLLTEGGCPMKTLPYRWDIERIEQKLKGIERI